MSEQQGAAPATAEAALVEELARLSHEQWSGWAEWMFEKWDKTHVSGESYYSRWRHQIATPYADLSEDEKESDRIEARKVLALIGAYADARAAEVLRGLKTPKTHEALAMLISAIKSGEAWSVWLQQGVDEARAELRALATPKAIDAQEADRGG